MIAALIVVYTAPVPAVPQGGPTLIPPTGVSAGSTVLVQAADDWATRTYNDPMDMTQRTDVSWWSFSDDLPAAAMGTVTFGPCTTIGTTTDTASRCKRGTTESSNNPGLYMLETGGPAKPVLGRTGDTYPIDASTYSRLTMRMRLGGTQSSTLPTGNILQSTMNLIWNERTLYDSPGITSDVFWSVGGWAVYHINLPSMATTTDGTTYNGPRWGASTIRTLRLNPVRISGVPVEIDWIRLTPSTATTSTFSWSGAGGGVDIYLDNDTNYSNGIVGVLVQQSCPEYASTITAGCPSTKIFGGPGLTNQGLASSSGTYTLPVGSLAPGDYYVQVCTAGTSACTASSWRYRVNAEPTLAFTNPHPEGSTDDFATIQLNNAWDFTALNDIDDLYFMTNPHIATVDATAEDGTALGPLTMFRGTSLSSGPHVGDPYFYMMWYAGDGRGRFKKIDTSRYHIATVEMGIPNLKRHLFLGSSARLVWFVDGDPLGENVSTDILVNHTAGENTLAKFITSMRTLPNATPTPTDPNPSPSNSGWTGMVSNFRFDPHEFPTAVDFYVRRIKVAANEVTVNNRYTVRWVYADADGTGTTPTMTVSYDTDNNRANGLSGTICTVNPAAVSSCTWDALGVTLGSYFIHASYSDGTNTNTRYSDWPVLVTNDTVEPAAKPRIVLDRRRLDFGGRYMYPAAATTTAPQTVRVSIAGTGGSSVAWTVTPSHPDIVVSPTSGVGDADIQVSMAVKSGNSAFPPNLLGDYSVTVSETFTGATANTSQTVRVVFKMYDTAATSAPFGVFDTPVTNTTVSGSIAVTGWAADDIGIDRVEIWRDLITNDPVPPFRQTGHPADGKVFIANGTSVNGSRPDVEAAFPGYPQNYRAGWGYLLLTWGFPNSNGTFVLTAIAWDREGKHTVLGTKTITVNNAAATKPFGSIDVPAYGATFSGHQFTFGWALTPSAGCTMAGGQLFMTIDSAPPNFPVTYGAARTDIRDSFPGFADSNNAGGAVALDSRNYSNGTHIIGWLVYDSCGNGEGVGSRFFTIQNASADTGPPPEPTMATAYTTFSQLGLPAPRQAQRAPAVTVARGFSKTETPLTRRNGRTDVQVAAYEHLALRVKAPLATLGPAPAGFEAYRIVDGRLAALPLGSSFDARQGVFYWQPIPGFRGDFDLVFVPRDGTAPPAHVRVAVGGESEQR